MDDMTMTRMKTASISGTRHQHGRLRVRKGLLKGFAGLMLTTAVLGVTLSMSQAVYAEPAVQGSTNTAAVISQVRDLRTQAINALKTGDFEKTKQLLDQAYSVNRDPSIEQMQGWFGDFEGRRQEILKERNKSYEEQMAFAAKAVETGHPTFAIDYIADAYLYTPDKAGFRNLPEVDSAITRAVQLAQEAEDKSEWLTAVRLFGDLTRVEPGEVIWNTKFKESARRVRMLAMYTPDRYVEQAKAEFEIRLMAIKVIDPSNPASTRPAATQPSTQPSRQPSTTQPSTTQATTQANSDENEGLRVDWRDTLKGVNIRMLADAMEETNDAYFRNVNYRDLTLAGLQGVRTLILTGGLEDAFPKLADVKSRDQFCAVLDEQIAQVTASNATSRRVFDVAYRTMAASNDLSVKLPNEVLINTFIEGALSPLDQFSSMIWPSELADLAQTTQGEFSGVGIQIQSDESGSLKVISPIEESPAFRAGVEPESVITHINGDSAKGITVDRAKRAIQGAAGSTVTLTIRNVEGISKDFVLTRETIKVPSIKGWQHTPNTGDSGDSSWDFFIDPQQGIAYLRLTNFTRETGRDLAKAVKSIKEKGGKSIIIDLRDNPGGLLSAATEVVDKFIGQGTIVSTKAERDGSPENKINARQSADDSDIPMVILVNQFSASASEIVSGALKDHGRAVVVGERTFGKGSVQMLLDVANRSAKLKLTTSHYYLPSGRCIHKEDNSVEWGVDPDITVEMTREQMIEARQIRQKMDVLRMAGVSPLESNIGEKLIAVDPQLSAAMLVLRMQLANTQPLAIEARAGAMEKRG